MRNKEWLRYSLASLTIIGAALSVGLVACGDDDDNGSTPTPDSGTPDGSTPDVDGSSDDASKPDSGPKPVPAKLQLVNAATSLGPASQSGALRFCYKIGTAYAPLPPIPDRAAPGTPFPGVFIGTGGNAAGTGISLAALAIRPVLLNAETLLARGLVNTDGKPLQCGQILGAGAADYDGGQLGALKQGIDYWELDSFNAGDLADDNSYLLVLTGCAKSSTAGVSKCGPDFNPADETKPNGNLKITKFTLDHKTPIGADRIGAEFVHASAAGASLLASINLQAVPGFIKDKNDVATFTGLTADAGVALNTKTPLVQVEGVNVATDSFTVNPTAASQVAYPLPLIQALSYGGAPPDGGAYRNGAAFTFIAVGDPEEQQTLDGGPGGAFNTKFFHYIALPNDPASTVYTATGN